MIADNAAEYGGGIACGGGSSLTLVNNTLTGNRAALQGGGLFFFSSSTLTNLILWDDEAPAGREIYIDGNSTQTLRYSDIDGGLASIAVADGSALDWGPGMIGADPRFVSLHHFDFLLVPASPCVDGGDPILEDGLDWPEWYANGPRSDMGAFGGTDNAGWLDRWSPFSTETAPPHDREIR